MLSNISFLFPSICSLDRAENFGSQYNIDMILVPRGRGNNAAQVLNYDFPW